MLKKTTILCTILLTACRNGTPAPVSTTLPATAAPPAKWTTPSAGSKAEPVAWLSQFNGGGMADAVREAVGASFDLQASAARMSQARARALRSGADLFPEVTTGLSSGQDWEKSTGRWNRTENYTLTLNASWEADLWGRVRDSRDASRMEAEAAAADYAAARLSTAAAAARAWCNLIEANLQADLVEETVASFRRNLATVDSNFDRGIPGVTALDVRLARSSLASAEANLQNRNRARDEARRSMETLLARYPAGKLDGGAALPKLDKPIPAGLPSTLLLRRPDIAAAERRVAAAARDESASRKALLPSIRLTSGLRTTSPELADLLDIRKLTASLAQGLTQPVFQGGKLRADIQLNTARREELAARYAQTALQAFREVETTLAAEAWLDAQIRALRTFAEESAEAERIALSLYEKGLTDILSVLESQRRAFESRSGLIRAENTRLQNRIDLCLALGGGF